MVTPPWSKKPDELGLPRFPLLATILFLVLFVVLLAVLGLV